MGADDAVHDLVFQLRAWMPRVFGETISAAFLVVERSDQIIRPGLQYKAAL
jgi:hypothetical protein